MRNIACVLLILFAACKGNESSVPETVANVGRKEVAAEIKKRFWEDYKQLILPSDGIKLNAASMLLDTDNNKHSLGKLVTRPTLVFRYSFKDCSMCIDSAYSALGKSEVYSKNDIIFITDALSYRDFVINAKAAKYKMPVYCIQSEDMKGLGLPVENQNLPFFFVLGRDLMTSKFYIPYKEMTGETLDYLNMVAGFVN